MFTGTSQQAILKERKDLWEAMTAERRTKKRASGNIPYPNGSKSYSDVALHRKIGALLRNHSSNKQDIREVAKQGVDWHRVRSMLHLGCGYGWFEEALDPPLDLLIGIDLLPDNRNPFLANARRISARCRFEHVHLPSPLALPPDSFDLVASVYSLYFFPEMLPEIRRLLAPGGIFLCITHSEAMLEEAEQFFKFRQLRRLIERFSAENGEHQLKAYFSSITCVDYLNELVFYGEDSDDLAGYIAFKKEFVATDVDPQFLKEKLLRELHSQGVLRFNKNDRIFMAKK
jgi:SAM-dependent methyltransferase